VVTNLLKAGRAAGATTERRSGEPRLLLMVLDSMVAGVRRRGVGVEGARGREIGEVVDLQKIWC
jgi:hypothetical protein